MALPLETAMVNSIGLRHVLDLAQKNGGRVLFSSTSEVYGDPQQHPQREDYWGNVSSTGPRSCYDEAKRFGEALCMIYVRSYKVDARLIRIFNTYGPNMDPEDGRMLPNFITQALANKPLTIYGDGQYTRSLCYVEDLVKGMLSVMESERPDAAGRVYNVGNPEEHTILEYAKLVLELIPTSGSSITYMPPVPDDPSRRRPDIGRARAELSWDPKVPLRTGLSRTIDYFREVTAAP
jgi:nucleoside-diphosphate-sugar epimerase